MKGNKQADDPWLSDKQFRRRSDDDGVVSEKDPLLYLTLFPADHTFEKDTLIQLWLALSLFAEEPMEEFAELFFEDCLKKGFFQLWGIEAVTCKPLYKFTGESAKKSKYVAQVEGSSSLDLVSPYVPHVSVKYRYPNDLHTAFCGFERFRQLRTLIFLNGRDTTFKKVPSDFFLSLSQSLQVLDMSNTRISDELLNYVVFMNKLRFIDLSGTPIKCLPENLQYLVSLQTLKLTGCSNLTHLPRGFRKLVNLRHLEFDGFHRLLSMPARLGNLTNIRTLPEFHVGREKGCSIMELSNLDNITGSFSISRLENVLGKHEAEKACLSKKSQINKLKFQWRNLYSQEDYDVGCNNGETLTALEPNTNLEELEIDGYGGFELPNWISDPAFSKLVSINLFEFENCTILSSLGQLPSLKYLSMANFHKLRVIDHSFYGGLGAARSVAFPKLKELSLDTMDSLEGWSGDRNFDFPELIKLTVTNCPKLNNLFTLSSLGYLADLEIQYCDMLTIPRVALWKLRPQLKNLVINECRLLETISMSRNENGVAEYSDQDGFSLLFSELIDFMSKFCRFTCFGVK